MALPGVKLVLTGRDFPIPFGILPVSQDEHALCTDRVRFVGDPVAAVVAVDELTAFEALELIEVRYEPLATIADAEEALAIPEPRLHDYGDDGNVHKRVGFDFGDVDAALAGAEQRVRGRRSSSQGNTHLPIEQHATLAYVDPRRQARRGRLVDADAALPAPRAGQGAGAAGVAHPRHRHAQRRRLRRQVRSVQPRDRRRPGGAAHSASRSRSRSPAKRSSTATAGATRC